MFSYGVKGVEERSDSILAFTVLSEDGEFVHATPAAQTRALYQGAMEYLEEHPGASFTDFLCRMRRLACDLGMSVASIDWMGLSLLALWESDRAKVCSSGAPTAEIKARGAASYLFGEAVQRSALGKEFVTHDNAVVSDVA